MFLERADWVSKKHVYPIPGHAWHPKAWPAKASPSFGCHGQGWGAPARNRCMDEDLILIHKHLVTDPLHPQTHHDRLKEVVAAEEGKQGDDMYYSMSSNISKLSSITPKETHHKKIDSHDSAIDPRPSLQSGLKILKAALTHIVLDHTDLL